MSTSKRSGVEPLVLRGSLIVLRRRCGKPGCHCATGEPHATPALSCSFEGKTRMLTLGGVDLSEVEAGIARYEGARAQLEGRARSSRRCEPVWLRRRPGGGDEPAAGGLHPPASGRRPRLHPALVRYLLRAYLRLGAVSRPARTVTAMIRIADPHGRRAHDAYHRFLRAGVWSMARLWRIGAAGMVATFYAGRDKLVLDLDDTLFHKSGRKVQGAGNFRDPIRSRPPRIVYALGLNLVVLTLRVQGPWGGEPLGLPINCRLFHKGGGANHNELACEMLREVAGWFPNHRFVLCAVCPTWWAIGG